MDESIETALERVKASTARLEELRHVVEEVSEARTADIVALREAGVTRDVIAAAAGVTPARVTQLLGRIGAPERPRVPRVYVHVEKQATRAKREAREAKVEPHRHHFTSIAWNHARGNYLVRQQCDCGQIRVIPVTVLPKELGNRYADASVVA